MKQQSIAAIKRYRTRRLAKLATRSFYLHKRKKNKEMATLMCDEMVALGGVYVKFLQGVLLRSKLLRQWQSNDRLKIFENLESEPVDVVKILQHELSKEKLTRIAMVQPQPFAAGSFGQVYYAQLDNGQAIIIKVLRPMVRELLKHDLRLLTTFSKQFVNKMMSSTHMQLNEALKEFRDTTLRETDYEYEAEFAAEMYDEYKNNPKFIIPQTYLDLCTPNIIVQDYVEGISVAQIIKLKEQGVDPASYVEEMLGSNLDEQLRTLGYEIIVGVFTKNRVQGDPHPGNVRLLTENRVGLIDFGISAASPNEKGALFGLIETYDRMFKGSQTAVALFEQGLRFFVSDLYRSLKKLASIYGKDSSRDYLGEVSGVAAKSFSEVTGTDIISTDFTKDQGILTVINSVVNKGNRFGLIVKLEASDILRTIQTYTSLVSSLGRYQQVVPQIMSDAVAEIRAHHPEIIADTDDQIAVGDAIDTIMNWLERVAERDPALFKQLMSKIQSGKDPLTSVKETADA